MGDDLRAWLSCLVAGARVENAFRDHPGAPPGSALPVECIQWAAYALAAAVEDVGVDHRRLHVAVAEQFLDSTDIVTILQEVSGEGVAE